MITRETLVEMVMADWKPVPCNCGARTCTRHGLNVGTFYQGSGLDSFDEALVAAAGPKALALLLETHAFLELCGYGNARMRRLAEKANLPERLTQFLLEMGLIK